ncbi:unnamed protein product, partial [Rhizoctonia solani]
CAMSSEQSSDSEAAPIPPPTDLAAYTARLQSAIIPPTRIASSLAFGNDLAYQRTLDRNAAKQLDAVSKRIRGLVDRLVVYAGGTDKGKARADDLLDGRDYRALVGDVLDQLLENADVCLDEFAGRNKAPAIDIKVPAKPTQAAASPVPSNVALPTPSSEGTPKNGSSSGRNKKDWSKATYEEKEKRMTKLIGEVVVKTLSKWKSDFSHESFKKTAKELTDKIAETEMRRYGHSTNKFDKLSDEKTEKVKKFVKLSAAKYISRQKRQQRQGSDSTPNDLEVELDTALTTPNDGEIKPPPFATSSATPSGSTPDAPASSLAEMQLDQGPSHG